MAIQNTLLMIVFAFFFVNLNLISFLVDTISTYKCPTTDAYKKSQNYIIWNFLYNQSCSSDPTTNYKTINLNLPEFFDQLKQL